MPPHQPFPRVEPAPAPSSAGDRPQSAAAAFLSDSTLLSGMLHVYLAFDWGEEIDLDKAQKLFPAELQIVGSPPPHSGVDRLPTAAASVSADGAGAGTCGDRRPGRDGRGDGLRFRRSQRGDACPV